MCKCCELQQLLYLQNAVRLYTWPHNVMWINQIDSIHAVWTDLQTGTVSLYYVSMERDRRPFPLGITAFTCINVVRANYTHHCLLAVKWR